MTQELADLIRWGNLVLLSILLAGMAWGWWLHRGDRIEPLGLAAAAFVVAGIYGTAESLAISAPPGGRPFAVTGSALIGLICVLLPIHSTLRSRRPRDNP
jgi:hypothetical protein